MKIAMHVSKEAAIREGVNTFGWQTVDLDVSTLTAPQREALLAMSRNVAGAPADAFIVGGSDYEVSSIGVFTPERLLAVIDARSMAAAQQAVEAAAQKAANEAQAAMILAQLRELPTEAFVVRGSYGMSVDIPRDHPLSWEVRQLVRGQLQRLPIWVEAQRLAEQWEAEAKAKREAEEQTREAVKAAKAAADALARKETIVAWLSLHGTESQKGRFAADLLPEGEIMDAMREQVFMALSAFPRYEKLTNGDVPCHREGCDGDVEVDVSTATELTDVEWQIFRRIKAEAEVYAGATVVPREHEAVCQNRSCEEPHDRCHRRGALVTFLVGPFVLTREFGLGLGKEE